MRNYFLLLLVFSVLACKQQSVELPKLSEKGTTDLYNTSQIWFFFEINGNDTVVKVNSKNKITNTHLIFNIDKKLKLKHIIKPLQEIQEKINANSVHKKEGMQQYFSYADTLNQEFSLYNFTGTNYLLNQDLHISEENAMIICGDQISYLGKTFEMDDLSKLCKELTGQENEIRLTFCQNTFYNEYLHVLTTLKKCKIEAKKDQMVFSKE
ncbi:MAG: hypothetical protein WBN28_11605 [Lutimonas sp.]